jgi:transposase InsO family protein
MHELVQARPRFGYRRIHVLLLRHGWRVNMKRVRRLYRLDGLQLRHRVRLASTRAFIVVSRPLRAVRMSTGAWTSFTMR